MIMEMFAFVGDRLVRKDDFYSYQVMEKTIKTVVPSLYKVNIRSLKLVSKIKISFPFPKEKNVDQRRSILAKVTHVFVTSLSNLPAHRRQDIFRLLMESIGQDECLWFAPIQLYDSVLLSATHKKNEETLKASLIFFFMFSVSFELISFFVRSESVDRRQRTNVKQFQSVFSVDDSRELGANSRRCFEFARSNSQ